MTTFEDGPAKGQHLMLRRAAKFLRVVESNGKWDALDQLTDAPSPQEKFDSLTARLCQLLAVLDKIEAHRKTGLLQAVSQLTGPTL